MAEGCCSPMSLCPLGHLSAARSWGSPRLAQPLCATALSRDYQAQGFPKSPPRFSLWVSLLTLRCSVSESCSSYPCYLSDGLISGAGSPPLPLCLGSHCIGIGQTVRRLLCKLLGTSPMGGKTLGTAARKVLSISPLLSQKQSGSCWEGSGAGSRSTDITVSTQL